MDHVRSMLGQPDLVRDMWFYVRDDHLAGLQGRCTPASPEGAAGLRHRGDAIDERYVATLDGDVVCRIV
jgi:hypothetical protein